MDTREYVRRKRTRKRETERGRGREMAADIIIEHRVRCQQLCREKSVKMEIIQRV